MDTEYFLESVEYEIDIIKLSNFMETVSDTVTELTITESEATEKIMNGIKRLKEILDRLVLTIIKTISSGKDKLRDMVAKHEMNKKISELKTLADDNKLVEVIDVWKLRAIYESQAKEYRAICKEWCNDIRQKKTTYDRGVKLVRKLEKMEDEYRKKEQDIKSKKIKVSARKVLTFIENTVTADGVFKPEEELKDVYRECSETLADLTSRTYNFAEEHGFVVLPNGLSDHLRNTMMWSYHNRDWLIAYAISTAGELYGACMTVKKLQRAHELSKKEIEEERKEAYATGRPFSKNDEVIIKFKNATADLRTDKERKIGKRVDQASTITAVAGALMRRRHKNFGKDNI